MLRSPHPNGRARGQRIELRDSRHPAIRWSAPPETASENVRGSAGVEKAALEVLVDVVLAHAEGTTHAHRGELAVVHQTVDRHFRDTHHRGNLGNGQELHLGDVTWDVRGHGAPYFLSHAPRLPHRGCHMQADENIGPDVTNVPQIRQSGP